MADHEINDLARRQIRAVAERMLQRAGVVGVVPTPLDAVARVAGIRETIDIGQLPTDLVGRRPGVLKRVIGAIFYRERTIFVDRSQGPARGRFIEAHEVIHKAIPWHETFYRLDDAPRVFGPTKKKLDREADAGAAELLFQGDLFVRRALDYETSIAAPIALAPEFGVSITAAVRHYAVYHPDPVAVIVAGRYPRANGTVPIWSSHESPSFLARFGSARGLYPAGLPASDDHADPSGAVTRLALQFGDVSTGELALFDLRGEAQAFVLESFCNQWLVLTMLAPKRATRFQGRRVRIAGSG